MSVRANRACRMRTMTAVTWTREKPDDDDERVGSWVFMLTSAGRNDGALVSGACVSGSLRRMGSSRPTSARPSALVTVHAPGMGIAAVGRFPTLWDQSSLAV